MSRLFLIRHAQATFFEANYDKLSAVGEEQAQCLGKYWAGHDLRLDLAVSGPRLRQRRTAEIVSETFRAARQAYPELTVMPEFDEYAGEAVLRKSLPKLLKSDAQVREWHQAYHGTANPSEKLRYFQRVFEAVIRRWVAGELTVEGVESWSEFCARVNRGFWQIFSRASKGCQVAVFCSAGPIGVAMQRALHLSPEDTLGTVWMSRNCSYSEFIFSGERFTLSAFNAHPHLEHARLLTYR
jgi:broad specificity phosphatase PhoE